VAIIGGIAAEDTVVRDKAAATLREKHLVAKLDRTLGRLALVRSVWGSKIEKKIFSCTGTGSP
jgi:hypothetical protein